MTLKRSLSGKRTLCNHLNHLSLVRSVVSSNWIPKQASITNLGLKVFLSMIQQLPHISFAWYYWSIGLCQFLHLSHSIGSSMNFACFCLQAGFCDAFCQGKWLSCGQKDMVYFNDDIIRDADQRVPLSIAGIGAAFQQIVVFVVWK